MFEKKFTLNEFKNLTNNFYLFLSIFLFIFSFKYVDDWSVHINYLVYLILTSFFLRQKRFNKNNLSLIINFYTTFFLTIPLSYIIFNHSYVFGSGSLFLPFSQAEYRQSINVVILKIILMWLFLWLSIYLTSKNKNDKKLFIQNKIPSINIGIIFVIIILGIFVSMFVNQNFISAMNNSTAPGVNIFRFLLSDPAIIIYCSILFVYYKNKNHQLKIENLDLKYFLFILLYFFNFLLLGSKAGILILYLLSFLFILSSLRLNEKVYIFFLNKFGIFILILSTILAFIVIDVFRANFYLSKSISFADLFDIFKNYSNYFSETSPLLFEKILKRLAIQGLDQFILINLTFSEYDFQYTKEFVLYIYKNFLNLMLPGTIYTEAYTPSSQLFTDLLFKKNLIGNSDEFYILKNFNTQPFSVFGFFTILFGPYYSMIGIFIYFFSLSSILNKIDDVFLRVVIVVIFYSSLIIFSFESTIALQIQLYFQLLFIHYLLLSLNVVYKKNILFKENNLGLFK